MVGTRRGVVPTPWPLMLIAAPWGSELTTSVAGGRYDEGRLALGERLLHGRRPSDRRGRRGNRRRGRAPEQVADQDAHHRADEVGERAPRHRAPVARRRGFRDHG